MKTLFQSRTFWLAVAQAVIAIMIAAFTELDMLGAALVLKSIADILLRVDTKDAIMRPTL